MNKQQTAKDFFKRRMEHNCFYCCYNNPNNDYKCSNCIHYKDKRIYTDRISRLNKQHEAKLKEIRRRFIMPQSYEEFDKVVRK